jgi:glycosyltransferase involved in cell wall biosynthesis
LKISIVCPTHRSNFSAYARFFELASLDDSKFEVIIRNNSSSEEKISFLNLLDNSPLRINNVQNKGAYENFLESAKLATGDFVLFAADDDWFYKGGLDSLYSIALKIVGIKDVTALTGSYLVSSSQGIGSCKYNKLDSIQPVDRIRGYFSVGPNLLFYSAFKKNIFQLSCNILDRLPYRFCHSDLLFIIPSLIIGRILSTNQVIYQWDFGDWEGADKAIGKRSSFCDAAGLPREFSVLDKLLTAIEGALLINSKLLGNYSRYDRSEIAKLWMQNFFAQYQACPFQDYFPKSEEKDRVKKFRERILGTGDISLLGLLEEISNLFREVDPAGAEKYFNFWSKL